MLEAMGVRGRNAQLCATLPAEQVSNTRPTNPPSDLTTQMPWAPSVRTGAKAWVDCTQDSMGGIIDYSFWSSAVKESKMGGGVTNVGGKSEVTSLFFKREERGHLGAQSVKHPS